MAPEPEFAYRPSLGAVGETALTDTSDTHSNSLGAQKHGRVTDR